MATGRRKRSNSFRNSAPIQPEQTYLAALNCPGGGGWVGGWVGGGQGGGGGGYIGIRW